MCLICVNSDKKRDDNCDGQIHPFTTFSQILSDFIRSGKDVLSVFREGIIDPPLEKRVFAGNGYIELK